MVYLASLDRLGEEGFGVAALAEFSAFKFCSIEFAGVECVEQHTHRTFLCSLHRLGEESLLAIGVTAFTGFKFISMGFRGCSSASSSMRIKPSLEVLESFDLFPDLLMTGLRQRKIFV